MRSKRIGCNQAGAFVLSGVLVMGVAAPIPAAAEENAAGSQSRGFEAQAYDAGAVADASASAVGVGAASDAPVEIAVAGRATPMDIEVDNVLSDDASGLAYVTSEDGKTATVVGLRDAAATSVDVPSAIAGYRVTTIGAEAFAGCTTLAHVSLPDSVASIGDRAFSGCTKLSDVRLPERGCLLGRTIFQGCTSLTSLYMPDGLRTGEGYSPGLAAPALTDVTFAPGIKRLPSFSDCSALKSVAVPDTVERLVPSAFQDCTALERVVIPGSVAEIGYWAFSGCTSLADVQMAEGLQKIDYYAFQGCSALESIDLPDSVTDMAFGAFSGCSSLATVKLSALLREVGAQTFAYCSALEQVRMPAVPAKIGAQAFLRCQALKTAVIPASVSEIAPDAFSQSGLASVRCPDGSAAAAFAAANGIAIEPTSPRDISEAAVVLPDAVVYQGTPVVVHPTVTLDGQPLAEGVDFAVSVEGGDAPGEATVSVYGMGDYDGKAQAQVTLRSAAAWHFSDVPEGAWYVMSGAVDYAYGRGIMLGYSDSAFFGPDDQMTRAQAAAILQRVLDPGYEAEEAAGEGDGDTGGAAGVGAENRTGMPDVEAGQWYTAAANWAVERGVIGGVEEADGSRTFRPNDPVTREQLCAIIANATASFTGANVSDPDNAALDAMPDSGSVSTWARDSVAWALNNSVISGVDEGGQRYVRPLAPVTRAQMAAFMANALKEGPLS